MRIHEIFRKRNHEKRLAITFYKAPCGEVNPIELYSLKEGYPYNCRTCGNIATKKILFLSPKLEVEGDFGPVYFCEKDVPDINVVATTENYYKTLYGK